MTPTPSTPPPNPSSTPRHDKLLYEEACNFDVPWSEEYQKLEQELNVAKVQPLLAERAFAADAVEMELFDTIQAIVPFVNDTYVDAYDSSVEIIRMPDATPINREQADRILALGFGCVYESIDKSATQWTATYSGKCAPRPPRDDSMSLKKQLSAAVGEREKMRNLLKRLHVQLESPSRNTTMTSYRRDGSVIISSDIREEVKAYG